MSETRKLWRRSMRFALDHRDRAADLHPGQRCAACSAYEIVQVPAGVRSRAEAGAAGQQQRRTLHASIHRVAPLPTLPRGVWLAIARGRLVLARPGGPGSPGARRTLVRFTRPVSGLTRGASGTTPIRLPTPIERSGCGSWIDRAESTMTRLPLRGQRRNVALNCCVLHRLPVIPICRSGAPDPATIALRSTAYQAG